MASSCLRHRVNDVFSVRWFRSSNLSANCVVFIMLRRTWRWQHQPSISACNIKFDRTGEPTGPRLGVWWLRQRAYDLEVRGSSTHAYSRWLWLCDSTVFAHRSNEHMQCLFWTVWFINFSKCPDGTDKHEAGWKQWELKSRPLMCAPSSGSFKATQSRTALKY